MRPPCSIVIPTYNARDLVDRCLLSLLPAVEIGHDEIIVVDDGSTDDTTAMLLEKYPDVHVEPLDLNQGFGAACNIGVERSNYNLVLLLNNDIVVSEGFLDPLTSHFNNPAVFAANAAVFKKDGATPGGGLVRGYLHYGLLRLRWAEKQDERKQKTLTLYANGAATIIDRKKYQSLNGFDPIYHPFYSEDLDISYRAYQRGWVVVFEPASTVIHDHSVTITGNHAPDYISYISKRNRIIFVLKNISGRSRLMVCSFWLAVRFLGCILTMDGIFFRAIRDVINKIPEIIRARDEDRSRYLSDEKIKKMTSQWYLK
ncbi:MAG: glycosyltransferase [Gemmatimonadota bacterium]|nr:glycosyltransferase [Gemmatimonadota bacterium]